MSILASKGVRHTLLAWKAMVAHKTRKILDGNSAVLDRAKSATDSEKGFVGEVVVMN